MKRFNEISSLYTKGILNDYIISDRYKHLPSYYKNLTFNKYVTILSQDPPIHPLAKRFDKLVRYTARLIGNPNINEIKKTIIKLLKQLFKKNTPLIFENLHELAHLIIGQNIEIFLRKKVYSPEHHIYETIASTVERGLQEGIDTFIFSIPQMITNKTIPLKKLYHTELTIFKNFFINNKQQYTKNNYNFLKTLLLNSQYITIFHLQKFFTHYQINPEFPLAINFKNEILKELKKLLKQQYYDYYENRLYKLIPYIFIKKVSTPNNLRRFLYVNFQGFTINDETIKDLFKNMEIFPETTKEIIKKFTIYMCAVIDKYPLP